VEINSPPSTPKSVKNLELLPPPFLIETAARRRPFLGAQLSSLQMQQMIQRTPDRAHRVDARPLHEAFSKSVSGEHGTAIISTNVQEAHAAEDDQACRTHLIALLQELVFLGLALACTLALSFVPIDCGLSARRGLEYRFAFVLQQSLLQCMALLYHTEMIT
jgi:hypothetical protein